MPECATDGALIYTEEEDLCRTCDLHDELRPRVRRPGELGRHLPGDPLVGRDPARWLCLARRLEGGEEEPVVEGEGTERLLDNQVKGEDQHKALLVLKPLIKRREIEEDGQKSCKKTFEQITCTCSSCTGRENVLASCRASSAPCRGTGPPAPSVKKKTCQEKNLHQHDQDMTKEDFSTCNLFSLKTTLA